MPARIDVLPDSALLVVHDADVRLPVVDRDRMDDLEREAAAGKVFFLAAEESHPISSGRVQSESPSRRSSRSSSSRWAEAFCSTCHRAG